MKKSIVFIHGLGLGEWLFKENFAEEFNLLGYDVHTFNLPGHNATSSSQERQRINLNMCASYVEEYLINKLHNPFVIIGFSMGGAILQKILTREFQNQYLKGGILLCSVPPSNNLIFTLRLCNKLALNNPDALVNFFKQENNPKLLFSDFSMKIMGEAKINEYMRRLYKGFSYLEYEIFFQNLLEGQPPIHIPLKVIGGADDKLFPPDVVNFTASYYSQKAEIIPDIGHFIPVEPHYPKAIDSITAFLKEIF